MGTFEATLALHGIAAASWGVAGLTACHAANGDRRRLMLGLGLAAGALLQAVDGLSAAPRAWPLMAWALLPLAGLGRLAPAAGRASVALVAVTTVALLHALHATHPSQPVLEAAGKAMPLALATGVAFLWLVMRGPTPRDGHDVDARWLLLTSAVGLVLASCSGALAPVVLAVAHLIGALPMIARGVEQRARVTAIAAATATATAFALLTRAAAVREGVDLQLAGFGDPLLAAALLFCAFGVAILRAEVAVSLTPAAPPRVGNHLPSPRAPSPSTARQLTTHDVVRDLRDPLTSILATATLVDVGTSQEDQQALLQQLRVYGRQMSNAMNDIDDLERLLRDQIDLAEEAFDLPRMLRACIDEVLPKANEREVSLRFDASPTLPRWVHGDPARTRQLVARLLDLATNRCTIGPVDISASADDYQLHVALLNHHSGVEDPTSTGVVFVQELARAMGGQVSLRARDAGGTEFHLRLPKQLAPEWEVELQELDVRDAAACATDTPHRVHGSVLLVTDNRDHQRLLGAMLAEEGADVLTADTGEMALHVLGDHACDLVLVDMQMPGCDGITTLRDLRDRKHTSPVLAVSSECDQASVERYLAAGCNGYLPKPVDRDVLRRALVMHLAPVK